VEIGQRIEISGDEIKMAMQTMGKNKAISCDGVSDYIF